MKTEHKKDELEGWQPIDTAPRDGSTMLITTQWGVMFVGYWYIPSEKEASEPYWRPVGTRIAAKPSHWMPLPNPPANKD